MEHLEKPTRLLLEDVLQSEESLHTGDGSVNIKGELAVKKETGTWKSCSFVLDQFDNTDHREKASKGSFFNWIPNNLNKGHLDYFFWLLAGLSFVNMLVYIVYAKKYKQKKACHLSHS
ncbi:hypothetical protein P8452_38907 [Trifolium repens]|nr:hypothetical protein P8452_38907 [Trifolium repens]